VVRRAPLSPKTRDQGAGSEPSNMAPQTLLVSEEPNSRQRRPKHRLRETRVGYQCKTNGVRPDQTPWQEMQGEREWVDQPLAAGMVRSNPAVKISRHRAKNRVASGQPL